MTAYFDHNASTPVDSGVLRAFVQAARDVYGNASSIHRAGQMAKQRLEAARRSVATRIGAAPREIVFTSGGTESDNVAILGSVRAAKRKRKHVITTSIEHAAVLATCGQLAGDGVGVTFLPVGSSGMVDPGDVREALRPDTVLVSVMHANNETGVIQPIQEIAAVTRAHGALLHCDGAQAAGRIAVDVRELGVDFYSFSAHKMNGPKGAGALFVREKALLHAIQYGGHQERERRAGTENVPAITGFGAAAELGIDCAELCTFRDLFEEIVLARIPGAYVHAAQSLRLPNTSNICFPGVPGEALVIALDLAGFAVSSGSACASGSIEPSHVLLAMGVKESDARSSLRFSMGLGNTREQVEALVEVLAAAVLRLDSRTRRPELQHA